VRYVVANLFSSVQAIVYRDVTLNECIQCAPSVRRVGNLYHVIQFAQKLEVVNFCLHDCNRTNKTENVNLITK